MKVVLDASALICFVRNETGADLVEAHFRDSTAELYAHSVNLCEVYYDFFRAKSSDAAENVIVDLIAAGIRERSELDGPFWRQAGFG
jgi:PIN domain nuclease of toxin-antitoxin system